MSRKDKVYNYVRNKIIHNEFKPEQIISENQLTRCTNVSRTPVREAISDLERDGFLVRIGHQTMVTKLTEEDVQEIYELRSMLETFALEKTINSIPSEELDDITSKFKKAAKDKDWDEYLKVDIEFHNIITNLKNHPRTKQFLQLLQGQIDRTRYLNENNHHRMNHSLVEHLEIIKMIKSRNLSGAENALKYHLQEVYLSAKKYLNYAK